VLPFDNLSRDTGDAYLARDLTEEITNRLVKLERLTVTSATVMRRYRGSDNPRAVAQTLHVAYLVSGSVRRDRDRLRIAVELLRASDGVSPWTDVFDRRDTSLLDIQIQIAQSVAASPSRRGRDKMARWQDGKMARWQDQRRGLTSESSALRR
jgi:TolB-like protein